MLKSGGNPAPPAAIGVPPAPGLPAAAGVPAAGCVPADARIRCYNCHEAGHVSQECPRPRMTMCYNCHRQGHKTFDCTAGKRCHICGGTDHLVRQCPANRPVTLVGPLHSAGQMQDTGHQLGLPARFRSRIARYAPSATITSAVERSSSADRFLSDVSIFEARTPKSETESFLNSTNMAGITPFSPDPRNSGQYFQKSMSPARIQNQLDSRASSYTDRPQHANESVKSLWLRQKAQHGLRGHFNASDFNRIDPNTISLSPSPKTVGLNRYGYSSDAILGRYATLPSMNEAENVSAAYNTSSDGDDKSQPSLMDHRNFLNNRIFEEEIVKRLFSEVKRNNKVTEDTLPYILNAIIPGKATDGFPTTVLPSTTTAGPGPAAYGESADDVLCALLGLGYPGDGATTANMPADATKRQLASNMFSASPNNPSSDFLKSASSIPGNAPFVSDTPMENSNDPFGTLSTTQLAAAQHPAKLTQFPLDQLFPEAMLGSDDKSQLRQAVSLLTSVLRCWRENPAAAAPFEEDPALRESFEQLRSVLSIFPKNEVPTANDPNVSSPGSSPALENMLGALPENKRKNASTASGNNHHQCCSTNPTPHVDSPPASFFGAKLPSRGSCQFRGGLPIPKVNEHKGRCGCCYVCELNEALQHHQCGCTCSGCPCKPTKLAEKHRRPVRSAELLRPTSGIVTVAAAPSPRLP